MNCQIVGCSQNTIPKISTYFKEELLFKILQIPQQKPDIERVLDVLVWPEVQSMKLVDTPIGMSNECQYLSGVKLVVEVKVKEKVTYIACEPTQGVHVAYYETLKSMFVILPKQIDEKSIHDLIRSGRVSAIPYVEAVNFRKLDCRNIYKCVMLFLDIKIC